MPVPLRSLTIGLTCALLTLTSAAGAAQLHRFDVGSVRIKLSTDKQEFVLKDSQQAGDIRTIPVALEIQPFLAGDSGHLIVAAGGHGFSLVGAGTAPTSLPFLRHMSVVGSIARDVDVADADGSVYADSFKLRIRKRSWGYLYADFRMERDGGAYEQASAIIFFVATDHKLVFDYASPERIVEKIARARPSVNPFLINQLRQRGEFARMSEELMREIDPGPTSALTVQMAMDMPNPCPALKVNASCDAAETSIGGTVSFDHEVLWPVTSASVRLLNEASNDDCLAQTLTDDEGQFLFCHVGSVEDLAVVVLTSGPHARVEECDHNTSEPTDCAQISDASSGIYAMRSPLISDSAVDASATPSVLIEFPGVIHEGMEAVDALPVFEAVNQAQKSLISKELVFPTGAAAPERIYVAFGREGVDTNTVIWEHIEGKHDANLEIGSVDKFFWDVIDHEYAHLIQHYGQLIKPVDGKHAFEVNLCNGVIGSTRYPAYDLGKSRGTWLAWSEAWATWFGTWIQQAMPESIRTNFPTVGDLRYERRYGLGALHSYDLESNYRYVGEGGNPIPTRWYGEGNEVAIQRVLWDIGDGKDPEDNDDLALGHEVLWDTTVTRKPDRLTEFVGELHSRLRSSSDYATADYRAFGRLLVTQQISPVALLGSFWDRVLGTRKLNWNPQFLCAEDGNAKTLSEVVFFDVSTGQVLDTLADIADSNSVRNDQETYTFDRSLRNRLFKQSDDVAWMVVGKDPTDSSAGQLAGSVASDTLVTGPYPGTNQALHKSIWLCLLIILLALIVAFILLYRWWRSCP